MKIRLKDNGKKVALVFSDEEKAVSCLGSSLGGERGVKRKSEKFSDGIAVTVTAEYYNKNLRKKVAPILNV